MAERVGYYTPETAKEVLLAVRQLKSAGLLAPGVLQSLLRGRSEFIEQPKNVINVSGEEIPAYACMRITGTEFLNNTVFLQVDKPEDTTTGPFIFNWHWPIGIDGKGVAQKHRILRAYTNGDPIVNGEKWQPIANDWRIAQNDGGQFTMCGEDGPQTTRVGYDVAKIEAGGGGSSGGKIEYTIVSVSTAGTSSPYNGLKVASVTVEVAPCGQAGLIGDTVDVVDHSGCLFNEANADLVGRYGWAHWGVAESLASGAAAGELTACHWCADGLCCP